MDLARWGVCGYRFAVVGHSASATSLIPQEYGKC